MPSSDSDESISAKSENFDPLKALYCPEKVKLPYPKAKLYDNLGKFESKMKDISIPKISRKVKKNEEQTSENIVKVEETPSCSRFLPEQEMVKVSKPLKSLKNVLTKMPQIEGPLHRLWESVERRTRVKVSIRDMTSVRGYCIGYVTVFDKHWNITLEDVTEVWKRKVKRKLPALGPPPEMNSICANYPKPPRVQILRRIGKYEECERHLNQLMLRGEQVAIIQMLPI